MEADALFAQVYDRLKAMAGRQLGARVSTLDVTALVHELYLRMGGGRELAFEHSDQFFTYAARAMRHLLADRARDRLRTAIEHVVEPVSDAQPWSVAARLWLAVADAHAGACERARAEAASALVSGTRSASDPHPLYATAVRAAHSSGACGSLLAEP